MTSIFVAQSSLGRWAAIVSVFGCTTGCSMTRTTTTVHATEGAPVQHVRLVRPNAEPLQAEWRQEGRQLVGQLSLTAACQAETRHVVKREQVTETAPNKAYYVSAYVVGALVSAVGLGFVANASGKSESVSCGSGGQVRSGDSCRSEAGAWRTGGFALLGTGLGTMLGGALVHGRKSEVQRSALLPEERVSVDPKLYACARVEDLQGTVVAAELSGGGKWLGTVDAQGVVRIELGSNANLGAQQAARFSVDSAPEPTDRFARPGLALGELSLTSARQVAKR
jgi:hypothetical protein